ncbi:hypothetical protein C3L33_02388, partial [Rhododendron williamsianum]
MDNLLPRKSLFVYTICLLSLIPITRGDYPVFFNFDCPDPTLGTTSTYALNSTYKTNLDTLFSALSSHSNNSSNGFYNFTAGSPPDIAYGLFLCRGDISSDECQDCIVYATQNVVEWCPKSKRVTVWLERCMLRYSNKYIFARQDRGYMAKMHNVNNITNETYFNQVLGKVMDDIVNRSSSDDSGKKFATAQFYYSPLHTLYGLAQCTPDISNSDCNTCLRDCISAFPSCCDGKQGAIVRLPSCNVRYEIYQFYDASFGATPPPPTPVLRPPPPSTTTTSSPGNGGVSSQVIAAIVASIGVVVMLFIAGFCFLTKRAKKKYNSVEEDLDNASTIHVNIELLQAWKLWREGMPLDLLDPTLEGSYARNEVTRCIHIALLCVQDDPDARPSMATIVLMLNSYSVTLSFPQQPRFLGRSGIGSNIVPELQSHQLIEWTVNEVSISEVEPR